MLEPPHGQQFYAICETKMRRLACASTQSDQRIFVVCLKSIIHIHVHVFKQLLAKLRFFKLLDTCSQRSCIEDRFAGAWLILWLPLNGSICLGEKAERISMCSLSFYSPHLFGVLTINTLYKSLMFTF